MGRTLRVAFVGAAASSLAVACRVPTDSALLAALAVATAVAAFVLGVQSMRSASPWLPGAAAACMAATLVLPTAQAPFLQVPAIIAVAPALLYLHLLFPPHAAEVPRLVGEAQGRVRRALRLAPWVLLAGLAAATPSLARWVLPDRIGMSSEAQGVAGPIALALMLGLAAVAFALALRRPHPEPAPADEVRP